MGFEYQVKHVPQPQHVLDKLLRSIEGFARVEPALGSYVFGPSEMSAMAETEVRIEPEGLYICVYGGGPTHLSNIILACLSELDAISVSKLGWQ